MKKRLLVTASTFPRWEGDTEPRFVLDLSKALCEYFDVTVVAPSCPGAKEQETLEGVKVIRYHYFPVHKWETLCYPGAIVPRIKEKKIRILLVPFLFLGLWWKLFRILKNYDVVHAHWLIPQGIVQSFFKKPYLVTGHGGDITSLNKGILEKLKNRSLKHASAVTVVSEMLKEKVLDICKVDNLNVVSMGCNISEFGEEYKVPDFFQQTNRKVVLFVGRLEEVKGVSYLIEAAKIVDAKFVIVGNGSLANELKRQAKDLEKRVEFLGAKSHEELRIIYASADIFVAPSITTSDGAKEGFGLVLIEAMASGLPIIGSDSGGISSIVKDGWNGFLVEEKNITDLVDKINMLIKNADLYEIMKKHAVQDAYKYDYKNIAREYSDILLTIIGEK